MSYLNQPKEIFEEISQIDVLQVLCIKTLLSLLFNFYALKSLFRFSLTRYV